MQKIKYIVLYVLFLFCLFPFSIHAQDNVGVAEPTVFKPEPWLNTNNVVPPSPQAASLGRYGNVPVNHYTGAPNINIPIYNLSGRYLSAPINLMYDPNSIKVNEVPSWVGLGWSLQVGGVITRSAKGMPDLHRNYYSNSFTDFSGNTSFNWDDVVNGQYQANILWNRYFYAAAIDNIETQPDVYYFNFPGYSGSFVILPDQSLVFREYTELEISPQFTGIRLTGFQIRDPQGKYYEFDTYVESTKFATDRETVDPPITPKEYDFNSSWYLKKIISADGSEEMIFDYKNITEDYNVPTNNFLGYSMTYSTVQPAATNDYCSPPGLTGSNVTDSRVTKIRNRRFLKSITLKIGNTAVEQVTFLSRPTTETPGEDDDPAHPMSNGMVLYGVQVDRKWEGPNFEPTKVCFLKHDFRTGRLTLTKLTEKGFDGNGNLEEKEPYEFAYHVGQLPQIPSNAIDHWGYYNGSGNPNSLIPSITLSGGQTIGGSANRNAVFFNTGLLKRITYPTKGYTELEFSGHKIPLSDDEEVGDQVGGYRIETMTDYSSEGERAQWRTFKYVTETGQPSGKFLQRRLDYAYLSSSVSSHFAAPGVGCFGGDPIIDPICADYSCPSITIFASTQGPLGSIQGSHIGYSRVEEVIGDDASSATHIGKTIYTFENEELTGFNYWEHRNGTLLSVEVKDNLDRQIRLTENFYEYEDCSVTGRCIEKRGAQILQADEQDNKHVLCELSSTQSEWRNDNGTYAIPCLPNGSEKIQTKFRRQEVLIKQRWKYITSTRTLHKFYDAPGGEVEQVVHFEYNDPNTVKPTASYFTNTDSNQEVHRTEIIYDHPGDIIGLPRIVTKKIDGTVVGGTRQTFDASGRTLKIFELLKGSGEVERANISGYTDGRPNDFAYMDYPKDEFTWNKGLLTERKKGGFTWLYDYTEQRLMKEFTDTDGQVIKYVYDGLQRLDSVKARMDSVITSYQYHYTPNEIIEETVFLDGTPTQTMVSNFDGLGRPTNSAHNDLVKQEYIYDEFGRVKQETYLPGSFKTYEYDDSPLNRVTRETYPDQSFIQQLYASENSQFKNITIDEKGKATAILTDLLGRQMAIENAESKSTVFAYDQWGDLETVTSPGQSLYTYGYDVRHRMTSKVIPGSGTYTYAYNNRDELQTSNDPNGNLLTYYYDQYGRDSITTLTNATASGTILKTVYLPESNGDRVDYTEAAVLNPDGTLGSNLTTSFEYDQYFRVDKTTTQNYTGNDIVEPTYNLADWVTSTLRNHNGYESLVITETSQYDKFGRATELTHKVGSGPTETLSQMAYNDWDQVVENILGAGLQWLDYTYNKRGWLEQINDPFTSAPADPLVSCTTPGTDGPFPHSDEPVKYFLDISVEELLRKRFEVQLKVEETGTVSPCQPRECDPPTCTAQEQTDQQNCLSDIQQQISNRFSRRKEVPCADGSEEVVEVVDLSQEVFPIELVRVRLCDGSEHLILENQVAELCGGYAIEQLIRLYSPGHQISVQGPSKVQSLTAEELIAAILAGEAPAVGSYVPCGQISCFPPPLGCSETEITLQEVGLEQIKANFPNLDLENLPTPITLYEIGTCPQEIFYVLEEEMHFVEGTPLVVLDTLFFDSLSQEVPVDVTGGNGPDKCADLFHLKLTYEPNGNVDTKSWQVYGRSRMNYDFDYDDLHRLTVGEFSEETPEGNATDANRYGIPYITYDDDGNIKTLSRRGVTGMCGNGLPEYGTIDLLAYEYDETTPNQKNRLLKVIDGSSSPKGFDPGITPAGEYTYDSNGNLTFDPHKGLTITYNHLNLPATILKGGDKIEIYYDATGRKLKQEVVSTEGGHVLEYMNGIDYRNQELNGIYHAEGRVTTGEGGWQYEYFLKDHLGNVRLSVSDLNGNGCIDPTAEPAEILQENHYYPFGLNMEGPWVTPYELEETDQNGNNTLDPLLDEEGNPIVDQDKLNRYQYNGKELTSDLGLNWNDYGARWYNPAIGRWNAVDPLAEKYPAFSSYVYVANNPIVFIDPDGMRINVAAIMEAYPDEWEKTLADLKEITGLELTVDKNGYLNYSIPEKELEGSETARNMLIEAIGHKNTVTVKGCDDCGSAVTTMKKRAPLEKRNEFTLARDQINRFIDGASDDLNDQTYGFGMNFLHEMGHTQVGGRMYDTSSFSAYVLGKNVKNMNQVRTELSAATGTNFGQRVEYNPKNADPASPYIYYAFGPSALESLNKGDTPTKGFIKVLRYPKKDE